MLSREMREVTFANAGKTAIAKQQAVIGIGRNSYASWYGEIVRYENSYKCYKYIF